MSEQVHDFNAERAKRHAEKELEFGSKPFEYGFTPRPKDEEGTPIGPVPENPQPEMFYVRANVGYQGIRRVSALTESSSGGQTFEAIEKYIYSMIDPRDDAHARLRAVLADEDLPNIPTTFDDLMDLQNWLIAEQTGRPPTQDVPSATSPEPTGPTSTEASSTAPEGAPTS